MFGFLEKMFIGLLSACTSVNFGESLVSKFERITNGVSLNNQSCQTKSTLVNISSNETLFFIIYSQFLLQIK